jgi:hypothetical protein
LINVGILYSMQIQLINLQKVRNKKVMEISHISVEDLSAKMYF